VPFHVLSRRAMTADDSAETAVFLLIYPYLYVYNRHKDADYF
jgi:hypothetical protein